MKKLKHLDTEPRVNFLDHSENNTHHKKKIFKVSKLLIYLLVILLISVFIFSYQAILSNESLTSGNTPFSFFKQLTNFSFSKTLEGEKEGRINILLLGMGGAGHEGPYLTDTIILSSINMENNKISMLSFPRDLLVEIPNHGDWKINAANSFGEIKNGEGAKLTKQVIEKITGLPIHYYFRVDFSGFEKLIDEIGGIEVYVERSFTDIEYPGPNYSYQTISFSQGWQNMDGATALKYTRSRHGNNGEGSDFARSKRQQKVLQAVKNKVFSYQTILSPKKLKNIIKISENNIATNLEINELLKLATLAKTLDTENIISPTLDDGPNGLLYSGFVNEAYVLQPKGNSFESIKTLAQNIFSPDFYPQIPEHTKKEVQTTEDTDNSNNEKENNSLEAERAEQCSAPGSASNSESSCPEPTKITEQTNLDILNGTFISGLAGKTATKLKEAGFQVFNITNAPEQNYTKTIIYKLTDKPKPESEEFLKNYFNLKITTEKIPSWVKLQADLQTDYLIVLGPEGY